MLRALFSGVSGLKAHQTKMDVIGNNIANVNTYGYKAQRVTFKDSFYETLSSSSNASENTGGGNPSQVGYGAQLNTIDVLHTRGGYVPTGQPMDVFIQGEGYLVARDSVGNESYTRVGNLRFDGSGNLVDGNKRYICGYPLSRYTEAAPAKAATSTIANMDVDFGAENSVYFNGYKINLVDGATPKTEYDVDAKTITVTSADSTTMDATALEAALQGMVAVAGGAVLPTSILSNRITVTTSADPAATTPADGTKSSMAINGESAHNKGDVIFDTLPPKSAILTTGNSTISFGDDNGAFFNGYHIKTVQDTTMTGDPTAEVNIANKSITIKAKGDKISETELQAALRAMTSETGTAALPNKIDLMKITVAGGGTITTGITTTKAINGEDIRQSTTLDKSNGLQQIRKPGTMVDTNGDSIYDSEVNDVMNMKNIQIGENGVLTGEDDNGYIIQIGQIALANIANPEALTLDGNSYMNAISNIGEITYTTPGSGTAGILKAGGLENSNVDLANEFSDMIMTQRGFQANSRIITVGDEMLQELVNLKR